MSTLINLRYEDALNNVRELEFVSKEHRQGFCTTILTGINGSCKSTILRDIVRGVVDLSMGKRAANLSLNNEGIARPRVLAVAGAAADRYPHPERNGKPTDVATPAYLYFGQRVGTNLLSRREIFDAACLHLLDGTVRDRFEQPFFVRIFETLGLTPSLSLLFECPLSRAKLSPISLFERLSKTSNDVVPNEQPRLLRISESMGKFLLDQFKRETFDELHAFVHAERRAKIFLELPYTTPSPQLSTDAIRLGLYADFIRAKDAHVKKINSEEPFSVFDLSSGEYHMLSTLLSIGFAVKNGDIVLVDEPEAGLHPQWQVEYMHTLADMTSFMNDGHLVVATHSPLVVSSATMGSTIVDLSDGDEAAEITPFFGASADEILLDHFGLVSSRNFTFVDKLQRAISLVENDAENSKEFQDLIPDLKSYREAISAGDPILEVLNALLGEQ